MSFGQNVQFLRKMRNKMTQEELAEKLGKRAGYHCSGNHCMGFSGGISGAGQCL
ncbi:MAG: helix-turn-helix domain-containing protein [Clostridiales bacterium]|nr:helix-turn-helix domain-containing protein [Clostridiales bacterium]MDY3745437.1 helix-turn-helix domain-containing protein [Lachnospiraceae bacterium]